MAFPLVKFNSSTGSDTQASGAGPTTAIFGTAASYSGSVFTLDGSPDLSGVATDGSHVIWVATSTGRRFFAINAVDDGSDTVTVDDAPAGTTSGLTWGIGGVRKYLENSMEIRNNVKPGWTVELADGHSETLTERFELISVTQNSTDGPVTFRGEPGATTKPLIITSGENYFSLGLRFSGIVFRDIEWRFSGTGLTIPIYITNAYIEIYGCTFGSSGGSASASSAMMSIAGQDITVNNCTIDASDAAGAGIYQNDYDVSIGNNLIFNAGGNGIELGSGAQFGGGIFNNIIHSCAGNGIHFGNTLTAARGHYIIGNVIYGNTGDGIRLQSITSTSYGLFGSMIHHNILYGNDYNISVPVLDEATLNGIGFYSAVRSGNAVGGATTGNYENCSAGDNDLSLTENPFVDAANGNFNLNNVAGGGSLLRAVQISLP